jgi:hypothetical protein
LLAVALATPPARAQAPFPIPVPASVLTIPLLLLLIPLGMELSKTDETRIRQLESREEWGALAALATRRLAERPGDLQWHEVRGRALHRHGRCMDAIADLRVAFEGRMAQAVVPAEPAFAAGLTLGLCEMAVWDLPAAGRTMTRLAQLAPERWEPDYNLGVIRALQGDLDGARAAQALLRPKNPAMADTLQARSIGPAQAAATAAPVTPADTGVTAAPPDLRTAALPVPMADARLLIGNRILVLPPGPWFMGSTTQQTVRGSQMRYAATRLNDVPVVTASAFAMTPDARLSAAVSFSANPKQAFGTTWWQADEPCVLRDALVLERFKSAFDQPECLTIRVVDPAAALGSAPLRSALQAAQAAGATLPGASYEVHYARYGMDWIVAATWLLPTQRVAGDLAVIQWAHALADGLRPLAREPSGQVVVPPPLGPMP